MAEDDRPRFEPPTANPPHYGVAGLPATPPPQPPQPPRSDAPVDPGPPQRQHHAGAAPAAGDPSNGMAVASLSLSIVGLALLVLTFGVLSFLSVPCSLLGWIFGHKAKQRPGERGMAQAGFVTGIVGTVLGALALAAWIALVVAADGAWDSSWTWD
ncbi:MAG TPA: DUF4190 domain-containing protein [Capillimicrobium sp.]|nr:DUF4190 domain-containing protein [Capillimicrobium sp.]